MAEFYNVFVDWEGRLGRELPGLKKALAGHHRVLDVGCGTGRHVRALLDEGFDAYGCDPSEEMLAKCGDDERFFAWRAGDPPPEIERFDAIICLGNVWPQITDDEDIERAAKGLRDLLLPGGALVMGLKAFALREDPYLPLLQREHEGQPIWFIRFLEPTDGPLGRFHMVVVRGEDECVHHRAHTVRVWGPKNLAAEFRAAGFSEVKVSGVLGEPDAPVKGEDVFVHARA